jgi:hypothetical protein
MSLAAGRGAEVRTASVVIVAGSLIAADPCYARDLNSVQALLEQCSSLQATNNRDQPSAILRANGDQMFCFGYISGVSAMMTMNGINLGHNPELWSELHGWAMCEADPASPLGAKVQAFKNYAAAHPEIWGQLMAAGVIQALNSVWPCRER